MIASVSWRGDAPAKVNLRLEVLAREASGYHQIETVFQTLTLADRVELTLKTDAEVALELRGVPPDVFGPPERNLAVRAADAFRAALEALDLRCPGVQIALEKEVPHGAGLGGASSDAAAVLRGLNILLDGPLSVSDMMRLGAELGSDVPFFVSGAVRALAWGRGDRILPLSPLDVREVLVVVPAEPIATEWAYGVLAAHRKSRGTPSALGALRVSAGAGWPEVESHARNDFEEALFPLRPDLSRAKAALEEAGARPALLSGSGSAVFGVFETEQAVAVAEADVRKQIPGVRTLRTRTQCPEGVNRHS